MDILLSLLLAAVVSPLHGPAAARSETMKACPPAHANSAVRVRSFLSSPLLPEVRARYDLGTASPQDIILLMSDRDIETCRALWKALDENGTVLAPGDHVSFYRSGSTFFVPITRQRQPRRPTVVQLDGSSSLDAYDADYQLIGRFGA